MVTIVPPAGLVAEPPLLLEVPPVLLLPEVPFAEVLPFVTPPVAIRTYEELFTTMNCSFMIVFVKMAGWQW